MNRKKAGEGRSILLLILAAVGIAGVCYFVYAYFQVRNVVIQGNALYTSPYVEALADVPEGTHMLQVDRDRITGNIESAEPYLRVLAINRTLPDTLSIVVEERQPDALLPYGTEYLLVDRDTVVLETLTDRSQTDRPEVTGISVDGMQVGERINTPDTFKVGVLQEILNELDNRDIYSLVGSIDLSNINNIRMCSTSGLEIRFGQAEKIPDKVKWLQNRLPALEREGQSNGLLDVSAGSFATYTMSGSGGSGGSDSSRGITTPPDSTADPYGTADPYATADPYGTADPDSTADPDRTADPDASPSPEQTRFGDAAGAQ